MPATNRSGGNRWLGHDLSVPDGMPKKPQGMSPQWNAKWDELVEQLQKHTLRRIDAHKLKSLVQLLLDEIWLAEYLAQNPGDDKKRRLYLQTVQQISRESALFGMSPADRKRLNVEPEQVEEESEWD